jgi:NAD(P)-dependent dehydrogenase (short-subunit alcohol dehydrogenase family)
LRKKEPKASDVPNYLQVAQDIAICGLGCGLEIDRTRPVFLVSDASSWITGHALDVNGGKLML